MQEALTACMGTALRRRMSMEHAAKSTQYEGTERQLVKQEVDRKQVLSYEVQSEQKGK